MNSRLRPWQGRTLPLSYSRKRRLILNSDIFFVNLSAEKFFQFFRTAKGYNLIELFHPFIIAFNHWLVKVGIMKLLKFILMVLLGLAAIWFAFWILGVISKLIYLAIMFAVLYIIGMICWHLFLGGGSKSANKPLSQIDQAQKEMFNIDEKLNEVKRQQEKIRQKN